jgi:hypothetical protein
MMKGTACCCFVGASCCFVGAAVCRVKRLQGGGLVRCVLWFSARRLRQFRDQAQRNGEFVKLEMRAHEGDGAVAAGRPKPTKKRTRYSARPPSTEAKKAKRQDKGKGHG